MKKFEEYYIGLDMGTGSVGWAVTVQRTILSNVMVRHYGEFACLSLLRQPKKEESFERPEEEQSAVKIDYIYCRKSLRKRLARKTWDSISG